MMQKLNQIPVNAQCTLRAFGLVTRLPNIGKLLRVETADGKKFTLMGTVPVNETQKT